MSQRARVCYAKACDEITNLAKGGLATFERLQPWACKTFAWNDHNTCAPTLVANITLQFGRSSALLGALAAASSQGLQLLANASSAQQQQQPQQDTMNSCASSSLHSSLLQYGAAAECTVACSRAYAQLLMQQMEECTGPARRRAQVEAAVAMRSAGMCSIVVPAAVID
jgi:hypothetical protein